MHGNGTLLWLGARNTIRQSEERTRECALVTPFFTSSNMSLFRRRERQLHLYRRKNHIEPLDENSTEEDKYIAEAVPGTMYVASVDTVSAI
jgi:hypothetical protein